MKRLVLIAITALSLGTICAGDFEDGLAAHNNGDYVMAANKFRLAAIQGDAEAQHNLGVMYGKGQGVAQDFAEEVKWYRAAVAQGNADAQFNLGVMYGKGQGVAQDYTEELKLYKLAAAQGNAKAQFNLGVMYGKGQGVALDNARAHMWFNLGATSGDVNAVKYRELTAAKMTILQVAQAQKMASDCQNNNFKGCD